MEKMERLKKWLLCSFLLALLAVFAACPTDEGTDIDNDENVEPPPTPIIDGSKTIKQTAKGQRIIHEIWGEPEVDPRNCIGYELETSGTKFFDRYIVLYGGRIINNDCVGNPKAANCQRQGLHLHFDDNVYNEMWMKHDTIIKPIRDAGIAVLMGLVPKDGGACIGVTYEWPMEPVWPWAENNNGQRYPYNEAAVEILQQQIIQALNEFGLDGVGYDEEYGNSAAHSGQLGLGSVYPTYSGQGRYSWTSAYTESDAWKKGGANIFRFAYNLAKKKPGILQDVYEIRYGAYIPQKLNIDGKDVKMTDVFGISYEPTYGGWQAKSSIGMPNARYGPVSIDVCSGIQPTALPPYGRNGIVNRMEDLLAGKYGVNMFYCLRSSDEMEQRLNKYYGTAGADITAYLSQISETLFKERTVYNGQSYPRLW
jgi:hypothetical protein